MPSLQEEMPQKARETGRCNGKDQFKCYINKFDFNFDFIRATTVKYEAGTFDDMGLNEYK